MDVREAINHNRAWLIPLCIGGGILVVVYSAWQTHHAGRLAGSISRAYFSDDEGHSYFADDLEKPFPFDHGGKQAYRAYIYRCGDSGKPFVGLLGRQVLQKDPPVDYGGRHLKADLHSAPIEVRKPGDTKWIPLGGPDGERLFRSLCADGNIDAVQPD